MRSLIETLLEEAFAAVSAIKDGVPREAQLPHADNMIKVAIGMRRSGKTYFLYQTINQLLTQGISSEQILFINFEDDRLMPMDAKKMGELIDNFYSLYPENHHRRCYLFLDEIQNVTDWHLTVRRYFDTKDTQIYLSGSSAKLLSTEINTTLRGRSLAIEISPYSFREYLFAHSLPLPERPFGQASFDKIKSFLLNYLSIGGFPAVQTMLPHEWRETLQNYVELTILKDIIERHNISNTHLLKYLTTALLKNTASPFSVNKFYNDIKSQGYKVGKETIHTYLDYLQDAFLIFAVPIYSASEREKQNKPKKIYAADIGLINAVGINPEESYGKLFENLVYLDLRRQHKEIYFYQTCDGYEIDFVAISQNGEKELIQVAFETWDSKTLEREQRALTQAEKELGIPGRIITVRDYLKALI
jgi:uncharacterized protein